MNASFINSYNYDDHKKCIQIRTPSPNHDVLVLNAFKTHCCHKKMIHRL